MVGFIAPRYTASRVKAAGKRLREARGTLEDSIVLDNWRGAHAYVLNTFQSNLRNRARGKEITVAQRLKRRPTIIDKLRREPMMQLNTMHDMAGCRVIFKTIDDLQHFRMGMVSARFDHILKSVTYRPLQSEMNSNYKIIEQIDKYNYIENPKPSGYRGVHDVYEYNVKSIGGKIWNGLHLEIQYRTVYQHAWATAVEVADIVTTNRIKFSESDELHSSFFQLSSEMIARSFEGRYSCLPHLSGMELVDKFNAVENRLGLLSTFRRLRTSERSDVFKRNTLLIFFASSSDDPEGRLVTETYENMNDAIARYDLLEAALSGKADVVLVRADTEANMRDAFRNYFSDTADFVSYMEEAESRLRSA